MLINFSHEEVFYCNSHLGIKSSGVLNCFIKLHQCFLHSELYFVTQQNKVDFIFYLSNMETMKTEMKLLLVQQSVLKFVSRAAEEIEVNSGL